MESKEFLFHTKDVESVLNELHTSPDGFSSEIAHQNLQVTGLNELERIEKQSLLLLFLDQFKDFVILILIFASFISILFGELVDFVAIVIILLLNAFLGFYQEYKAEKSIESLQDLTAPHSKVLRDGEFQDMDAKYLVPGDIIKLESGDVVPSDCRILSCNNLYVDESSLTGESIPVKKDPSKIMPIDSMHAEQINMLFMATNIVKGSGTAVVTTTGMATTLGRITTMLHSAEKRETPLKRKLNDFGVKLGWVILVICGIVVVIGVATQASLITNFEQLLEHFVNMLIVGVALAVAAIPEGLPAVVTVALSIGVIRMAKEKAIVRNLESVETLGSTTVICTDKTGTLTQNKMTIEKLALAPFDKKITISNNLNKYKGDLMVNGVKSEMNSKAFEMLMKTAVLCNNARIVSPDLVDIDFKGEPTETALLIGAYKCGFSKVKLDKKYLRKFEFPFDSERKRMSTINFENGKYYLFVKGGPGAVKEKCKNILLHNKIVDLNSTLKKDLEESEENFASEALRVLAFAFRELSESEFQTIKDCDDLNYEEYENELTFLGLMAMKDPPRPEAISAIRTAQTAGIRVIMVTGDHANTALAIGRQMGLIGVDQDENETDFLLTGKDLKGMTQDELTKRVKNVKIFARVSPEHKLNIVTALQENQEIVAMTGDGVNDAPALKQADIGVAMGEGGTDVAKQASDMVLIDDNFATLELAVEEGRGIFANMKKFIGYLLACNAGEVLTIFLGIVILALVAPVGKTGLALDELIPLVAIQILYVNLLTDGLPALALGVDPKEPNIMENPPRDPNESIFNVHLVSSIILAGLIVGIGTLIIFFYELGLWQGLGYADWVQIGQDGKVVGGTILKARTMAFTLLIFFQQMMALSSRSEKESLFFVGVFANKYLWAALLFTSTIHLLVIYFEPLSNIFGVIPLEIMDWVVILGMATTVFIAEELRKLIFRHLHIN